jgi:hypothetical protein
LFLIAILFLNVQYILFPIAYVNLFPLRLNMFYSGIVDFNYSMGWFIT